MKFCHPCFSCRSPGCGHLLTMLALAGTLLLPHRSQAAQPLEIEWQKSYSGTAGASGCLVRPTPDGGYAVLGSSQSAPSGNKTSPAFGSLDYWILRLDAH